MAPRPNQGDGGFSGPASGGEQEPLGSAGPKALSGQPSRRPLLAGNWKMHTLPQDAERLATAVCQGLADLDRLPVDVLLCPPFTSLPAVHGVVAQWRARVGAQGPSARGNGEEPAAVGGEGDAGFGASAPASPEGPTDAAPGLQLDLGAQNVAWGEMAAFTGEISAPMLRAYGCTYVIVGHSERRRLLGETDAVVQRRLEAALQGGLRPILCVGEDAEERQQGRTRAVVLGQVAHALAALTPADVAQVVVAYEPLWAIGTGQPATPADAQEVAFAIRQLIRRLHGDPVAGRLRILYGGSVKPDNIEGFMGQPDVDGALVGGASLDGAAFVQLVRRGAAGAKGGAA